MVLGYGGGGGRKRSKTCKLSHVLWPGSVGIASWDADECTLARDLESCRKCPQVHKPFIHFSSSTHPFVYRNSISPTWDQYLNLFVFLLGWKRDISMDLSLWVCPTLTVTEMIQLLTLLQCRHTHFSRGSKGVAHQVLQERNQDWNLKLRPQGKRGLDRIAGQVAAANKKDAGLINCLIHKTKQQQNT